MQRECRGQTLAFGQVRRRREAARTCGGLAARCGVVIARPDHRRIDEPVAAVGGQQQLGVAQLDLDLIARQDVGHAHLEHIGPPLIEQRSAAAGLLGGLVFDPRALLLANVGCEYALADAHRHAVHGGLGRTGEDVERFDRARALVAIDLGHAHIGHRAGHARLDAGGLQRQAVQRRVCAGDVEVRPLGRRRLGVAGLGWRPRHDQQGREQRCRDGKNHTADLRSGPQRMEVQCH